MADCPFCARIAAGNYEISDVYAVAFEPLNPVTKGHLLVVPRKHVPDAGSDPLAASRAMALAAQITGPLEWAESYNLITSAGAPATQTVMHLHIHIVPRLEGDGLCLPWTGQLRRGRVALRDPACVCGQRESEHLVLPGGRRGECAFISGTDGACRCVKFSAAAEVPAGDGG